MPKVTGKTGRNSQGNQESTKNKSFTKKQMDLLLDLLEINPDIAKGFTRTLSNGEVAVVWRSAAELLNPHGPPVKDGSGWKTTWAQYKCNLKKKILQNKTALNGTGGGPYTACALSATEERAAVLANIYASVNGIASEAFGVPGEAARDIDDQNQAAEDGASSEEESDQEPEVVPEQPVGPSRPKKNTAIDLLARQVQEQESFNEEIKTKYADQTKHLNDIVHYQRQSAKALQGIQKLKSDELDETKRHNQRMEQLQLEKLNVKKAILEAASREVARNTRDG